MRTKTLLLALGATLALVGVARADEDEKGEKPEDSGALLQTLPKAKVTLAAGSRAGPAKAGGLDTAAIEQLTGAKGQLDEKEGVFKVSVPRNDLQPTVAGMKLPTSMGLTAWAAFEPAHGHTMVMGDIVLTEDQVNPVMSAALDAGLEVTALHNHFFWETPRVMFMHIGGTGDQRALATAVGKVFAKLKETAGGKGETPSIQIDPAQSSLDTARLDMTGEEPRMMFLHYWGVGPAQDLARGLRTALDRTATRVGMR